MSFLIHSYITIQQTVKKKKKKEVLVYKYKV